MPYSTVTYTADGLETDFLITWNYLDTDHITVEVNDVLTTDVSSTHQFALIDSTTIRVTDLSGNPVTSGLSIELKRATPIDTRAVTFAEGSALRTTDLNKNSDYLLYAMQEAVDTIDVAAQEGAATAQTGAEAARIAAEAAQVAAESARDTSQTYLSTVQSDASTATTKAGEASTSETNAATSETNAATSETNAATSETNASNSATASANSATASANSAASILNAETNSAASATAAATSATDADTAKTASESARDTTQGYLATVQADAATATTKASEANTSATNAASSETNAATSASNAATSASNASTSETNASTSETNAATSASNASTSETNAATSATDAITAKTAAEAALDEFTDLYLGSKSSSPTLDNDGDALQTGALYFDTTANKVKLYNGSLWVDAASAVNGTVERQSYTATASQTTFSVTYDVGFVDIWLNGIKLLDGTDFTATNGTSIVLTTGASVGDLVDIIAFGTFALANHYTKTETDALIAGADSTPSIDDNGNATVITIDSNEGVNIGKTSASLGSVGLQLSSIGYSAITTNHNTDTEAPLRLNRLNGDGALLKVFKDSSEVGSIGTDAGIIYAGGGDAFLGFDSTYNLIKPASTSTGGGSDGLLDLGGTTRRFKDAYLSGGVYLGGTGSANKLDDYEEGTFTPVVRGQQSAGTTTGTSYAQGKYTKIGRMVHLFMSIGYGGHTGTGSVEFANFPFVSDNNAPNEANGALMIDGIPTDTNRPHKTFYMGGGSTSGVIFQSGSSIAWNVLPIQNVSSGFRISVWYHTNQ